MKKLYTPIALIAALALAGCSATSDAKPNSVATDAPSSATAEAKPVEEVPPAPDLNGTWKQSNSQSETDYMVATIADGIVSVDWQITSEDITAVYWVGSFETPADGTEPVTWMSQRDVAATETALMASTDDTKEFSYADDVLSFVVTIQGQSATVELKRS